MEELNDLMPISPDHNRERLDTLKQLFPDLFTNEGKLNPDELKKLIAGDLVSESERYEFRWHGKSASKRTAFTPSMAALVFDLARSVNPDKAGGNMIIEGENLEVLKLLTSAYRERVKCIYIDPPYNTGKDFVYADNFTKGKKAYWEETGSTEDGVKVDSNSDSSGRYHSDWLSMMHSRLLIARQLLTYNGFIVVSIDDDELYNLKKVLDDTFGEENCIATLVWDRNRKNDATFFSVGHEYMVVYARDKQYLRDDGVKLRATKEGIDDVKAEFERLRQLNNNDWDLVRQGLKKFFDAMDEEDPRKPLERYNKVDDKGPYRDDGNINWPGGGGPTYDVFHPKTGKPCKLPASGWRYSKKETMQKEIDSGKIAFGPDESTVPGIRTNLFDKTTQVMKSVDFSYAQTASQAFNKIFDNKRVFDNPKHYEDIKRVIEYLTDDDDIILDFFAGSGTTGHAVLELNKYGTSSRQFIMVQFPEMVNDKKKTGKTALALGLKKISDITIERVKRVIQGFNGQLPFDEAGFKVYKLTKSSFPRVEFSPDPDKTTEENVELLKVYIRDKETAFHIAFEKEKIFDEVLLKNGFMLDYTLTRQEQLTKNEVYLVKDTYREALLCLDVPLDMATVDWFKDHKEQRFICLEQALDTTRKWNLKHQLGDKFVAF